MMAVLIWVLAITGALTWLGIVFVAVAIMLDDGTAPTQSPFLVPELQPVPRDECQVIEEALDAAFPLRTRDEVLDQLPANIRAALGWKPPEVVTGGPIAPGPVHVHQANGRTVVTSGGRVIRDLHYCGTCGQTWGDGGIVR